MKAWTLSILTSHLLDDVATQHSGIPACVVTVCCV